MRPRNRWIKLYTIAYFIAIAVVIPVLIVMYHYTAPQDRKPIGVFNILGMILFFVGAYVVCFLIVGIRFANRLYPVQCELEELKRQQTLNEANRNVTVLPEYSRRTDGPGRYRIQGVDQKSEQVTTIDIEAESAANAKVKAELRGVIVSAVTKTT